MLVSRLKNVFVRIMRLLRLLAQAESFNCDTVSSCFVDGQGEITSYDKMPSDVGRKLLVISLVPSCIAAAFLFVRCRPQFTSTIILCPLNGKEQDGEGL